VNLQPVTLEGRWVRLVPLSQEHYPVLCALGADEELWRYYPARAATPEEMSAYVRSALEAQDAGTALPFVTVDLASGHIVGSTRFMNADHDNRRVEIGSTWIAKPWQRTAINTEAKYLMLRHAFETLGCIRVELKTDALNRKSRAAILRIGAKEEGTLRQHMVVWDGRLRDSVYFSLLDSEWPGVKRDLERKLIPRV
jgi:RimJ/RimL family protein N-acetyltransferase